MKTKSLAWMRIALGLLVIVAVASQLRVHIRQNFDLVNFFSYFTNLSNIFIALVFLYGGSLALRGRAESQAFGLVRGAAALAMVIVGVVFSVLLRNVELGSLQPWVNIVLHYIMPVAALVDWLIAPPTQRLAVRQLALWLVYPVIYVGYSLIRGSQVGWYAYPFLNPAKAGGWGGVGLYCLGITAAFLLVGWGLMAFARRQNR